MLTELEHNMEVVMRGVIVSNKKNYWSRQSNGSIENQYSRVGLNLTSFFFFTERFPQTSKYITKRIFKNIKYHTLWHEPTYHSSSYFIN